MQRILVLSVAALLTCAASPTYSQDKEIVVGANPSVEGWVQTVGQGLDTTLASDAYLATKQTRDGVVKVRFQAGFDGRPTNVRIVEKSGDYWLDRAAMRAVSDLEALRPLPTTLPESQVFQANIIGASTEASYDRLSDRLTRQEASRMASSNAEATVLAFNLAVLPNG